MCDAESPNHGGSPDGDKEPANQSVRKGCFFSSFFNVITKKRLSKTAFWPSFDWEQLKHI